MHRLKCKQLRKTEPKFMKRIRRCFFHSWTMSAFENPDYFFQLQGAHIKRVVFVATLQCNGLSALSDISFLSVSDVSFAFGDTSAVWRWRQQTKWRASQETRFFQGFGPKATWYSRWCTAVLWVYVWCGGWCAVVVTGSARFTFIYVPRVTLLN